MFDTWGNLRSVPDAGLIDRIRDARRAENAAAAHRLAAIAVLVDRHTSDESDERWAWRFDPWDALAAQISAAQGITPALASSQMRYARALNHRLHAVAVRFSAGDIDFPTVALIVQRTDLLTDDEVVAEVDAAIAERVSGWERWSRRRITAALDVLILQHDPDAKRRARNASDARHVNTYSMDKGRGWLSYPGLSTPNVRSH